MSIPRHEASAIGDFAGSSVTEATMASPERWHDFNVKLFFGVESASYLNMFLHFEYGQRSVGCVG